MFVNVMLLNFFKSKILDIHVVIVLLFIYCVIIYCMLHFKRSGTYVAHKGIKSKCCQHCLQGMKFQKISFLTSMCPTLLVEVIPITNHSTQILSGMHLSHYND